MASAAARAAGRGATSGSGWQRLGLRSAHHRLRVLKISGLHSPAGRRGRKPSCISRPAPAGRNSSWMAEGRRHGVKRKRARFAGPKIRAKWAKALAGHCPPGGRQPDSARPFPLLPTLPVNFFRSLAARKILALICSISTLQGGGIVLQALQAKHCG